MKKILSILLPGIALNVFGQVDTAYWQRLSPCPCGARIEFGSFLIDSNFYIFGGEDSSLTPYRDVWKYNITSNQWQQMNNLPEPTTVAGSFLLNGKGYFLTARDSINNFHCDSAVFEYEPITDSWVRKANLSTSRRQGSSAFAYNGKGYLGFGSGCGVEYKDMWEYNPATNHWAQLNAPALSVPQGGGMCTALSSSFGKAYIMGGGSTAHQYPYRDLWEYDIAADRWDSLKAMPGPGRYHPLVWSFDSVILAGGGEVLDSASNIRIYRDFYKYNISFNVWSNVEFKFFLDSATEGATFVLGKKGYFFGGYRSIFPLSFYNDMWSFDATPLLKPDTVSGVETTDAGRFKLYPNPAQAHQNFQISTALAGDITFYNSLGQVLLTSALHSGINSFHTSLMNDAAGVIPYKACFKNGSVENGRMVIIQ